MENIKYKVIDFKGYVKWIYLLDGSYAVDPQYLELFLKTIK